MLGIVDSSVILIFGSLDALTAILSVKNHEFWPYYAAASAPRCVDRCLCHVPNIREGEQWLEKRIGAKRSRRVQSLLTRWGLRQCLFRALPGRPFSPRHFS